MEKRIKEAIILVGGLGTRLRSEIGAFPKPLADINGTPFLTFIFDRLEDYGIKHIVLATGYKGELIHEEYGDTFNGIKLTYSEEKQPLGTGGAIKEAMKLTTGNAVFVLNGDTYFDIDLHQLEQFHFEKKAVISIAGKQMFDFKRYGTIEFDANGRIRRFKEKKPMDEGVINGGIYILDKSASTFFPNKSSFAFETEVLAPMTTSSTLYVSVFDDYFIDIGLPEDYQLFKSSF